MDDDRTVLVNYNNDSSLDEAYMELGKAYYEGGFEDPLPQLLPIFDKITRLKNQMPVTETDRSGCCPNCGEPLEDGAAFCGNCGYKIS